MSALVRVVERENFLANLFFPYASSPKNLTRTDNDEGDGYIETEKLI